MTVLAEEKTGLGNYFIANYPPFSFWRPEQLPAAMEALARPPAAGTPLGLYLHIPFCRKRCKFCYFRVYTDKNARDIEVYLEALIREVDLLSRTAAVRGRPVDFVYFGGGTPSYLSAGQLQSLVAALKERMPWDQAQEVTFECEPGTLQQPKLAALRELGVTRLSLGIENFDDRILEENGRAHHSAEIFRAYRWARDLGFEQINIDLIAGMVGETDANWRECIRKTIDLAPESVTIYQMELPYNTVLSKEVRTGTASLPMHGDANGIADWPTKRAWVRYAYEEMTRAGYDVSSAYTLVRDKSRTRFVYRDALWHGADMLGTGVASFGHVSGVHMQNLDDWEGYVASLEQGKLPLHRALAASPEELQIRELILQLKTGHLEAGYFQDKFQVDIRERFAREWAWLQAGGYARQTPRGVELTPEGLLQVDRLLPEFFLPIHRGARYT